MNSKRICPVERAGGLDNPLRRIFQDPQKILKGYIKEGMKVIDLGCGPGFFTIDIAKMLKNSGEVIAADLQEGMLEKVRKKIKGTNLEDRILLHRCDANEIGIRDKVDFVLAFYMVHEVPDQEKLFSELKSILQPNGKIFIIEPKFHVTLEMFNKMIERLENTGFKVIGAPKVFFSRTLLLKISDTGQVI